MKKIQLDRISNETKKFAKINLLIFFACLLFYLSVKITTERKYKPSIEKLEKEISGNKIDVEIKEMRNKLRFFQESYAKWEESKKISENILLLLLRISKVISKSVKLDEIEIVPEDGKINFIIKGNGKEIQNVINFSKRLNKKRGEFRVNSEIIKLDREGGSNKFIIKGNAFSYDKGKSTENKGEGENGKKAESEEE
ncbi:hypothetical protein HRbin19_01528 [bacterium HR19]|nr:hypothetical protein HRbin19_01528 [bacterium HR19]